MAALRVEEPDKVPLYDAPLNPRTLEGISGKSGVRVTGTPKEYLEVHKGLHMDMAVAWLDSLNIAPKRVSPGIGEDEWGIRWRVDDGHESVSYWGFYVTGPLAKREDLDSWAPPDPYDPKGFVTAKALLKLAKGEIAVAGGTGAVLTRTCMLMGGWKNLIRALHLEPDFVARIMDTLKDYWIEVGKQFIDIGVDLIYAGDDYGESNGPIISPQLFRRFVFPRLKEMFDCFRKRGMMIMMHSDGDNNLLMEDLIEAGIQGYNPIERKAGMDLKEMKDKYGDRLCLNGNLDATYLLQEGTEDEIVDQIKECFRIAAPGGGYIFGTDGGEIPPHISPERARFAFDTALRIRDRYNQ